MENKTLVEALRAECEDCSECGVSDNKCHSLYYCPNREAADRLEALTVQLAEKEKQLAAAVELIGTLERCIYMLDAASEHVRPNAVMRHTTNFAMDAIGEWRGPQEAGEGGG